MLLPLIFTIILLVNSVYVEKSKVEADADADVRSAERVLKRVFQNLNTPPITKMTEKLQANCPEGFRD